ncbi:hypothetical protein SD427_18710 (plasmid) [Chryseobacterium sp. JJR-5R]|uniref:hypothetical protein n=1 Tax=Chryseobacterium sp. JJR-5R TaxID=3093923 RepID=UPI002A75FB0F|nr:hypothetical protein [Chryseobacterium sp. JJR-5R]WPO84631.1 hypothetical protein SD427_18710 [Chryseobacterium sp. JJR-5R]
MKRTFIAISFFLAIHASAQLAVKSVQNKETELLVNDSLSIRKGDMLQIYLPAGKDFMFIKQIKSMLSTKLIGNLADIAGTGASAVGLGSGNANILQGAGKVMNMASVIHRGADALNKIQDLPISSAAKKIAGKKMEVVGWELTDDGYIILVSSEKKKYEIYLQEAALAGEIAL